MAEYQQPKVGAGSGDKLDFKGVLFLQMERIDDAATRAWETPRSVSLRRFQMAVNALEDRLADWDGPYKTIKNAQEKIELANDPGYTNKQAKFYNAVRVRNQGLQELLRRKKLMPAQRETMYPETPWVAHETNKHPKDLIPPVEQQPEASGT